MTGRMTTSDANLPWFYWVIDTHWHKCMRFATETSLGVTGRIRLPKNVDRIARLKVMSGECRIGVKREIQNRERADRVEDPDRDTSHQVTAPRCATRATRRCQSHNSGTKTNPAITLIMMPTVGTPWPITDIRRASVPATRMNVTSEIRSPYRSICGMQDQ